MSNNANVYMEKFENSPSHDAAVGLAAVAQSIIKRLALLSPVRFILCLLL